MINAFSLLVSFNISYVVLLTSIVVVLFIFTHAYISSSSSTVYSTTLNLVITLDPSIRTLLLLDYDKPPSGFVHIQVSFCIFAYSANKYPRSILNTMVYHSNIFTILLNITPNLHTRRTLSLFTIILVYSHYLTNKPFPRYTMQ